MSLITVAEFAVWAREEIADDDAFTLAVLEAASLIVSDEARQPLWTAMTAPPAAKLVTALLALRTWTNPPVGETSSTVGPISSTLVKDVAASMHLTDQERARLATLAPAAEGSPLGGLWVMALTEGEELRNDIVLNDSYGSGMPYGHPVDAWAFTP